MIFSCVILCSQSKRCSKYMIPIFRWPTPFKRLPPRHSPEVKRKVCVRANKCQSDRNMKRSGVFLLLPGWDASQGLPPALNSPVLIDIHGWREVLWEWSVLPKNTTQCPRPGLEPGRLDSETSALTGDSTVCAFFYSKLQNNNDNLRLLSHLLRGWTHAWSN